MELLIIWLMTILISIGLDINLSFKMLKDIADQGYKLEMDRFNELSRQMNPRVTKNNKIDLFIPFLNLYNQFDKRMKYEQARPFLEDQLRIMDCITAFTQEEQENYNKKPTGFNALLIIIKSKVAEETKEDVSISFTEGDEKNTIWFEKVDDDFKIIKTSGPVSRLSLEEQKNILKENLEEFGKALRARMTKEELKMAVKENKDIDLSKIPVKEETTNEAVNDNNFSMTHSTSEVKQQLEQLKNDIVSSECNTMEDGNGYSKVLKPHDKK